MSRSRRLGSLRRWSSRPGEWKRSRKRLPIPVSVVGGTLVADTGAFNVNRLKEQIPTVQFYSTNPRNSSVQIRGLGAPFGSDKRRHRTGSRNLHRRRLLCAAGGSDARLPRRRACRSAARTARDAVRQEHDGGRHQRHDARPTFRPETNWSSTSVTWTSCRPKGRFRAPCSRRRPDGSRSLARSATARSSIP